MGLVRLPIRPQDFLIGSFSFLARVYRSIVARCTRSVSRVDHFLVPPRLQVAGVVGRADVLATLFSLLSFISHDR